MQTQLSGDEPISNVYYLMQVKEWSETNWEAYFNVGNGSVTVIGNTLEHAMRLALDMAFNITPKEVA